MLRLDLRNLFFVIFCMTLFFAIFVRDPVFFFHVKAGEDILRNGAISATDPYSFTHAGGAAASRVHPSHHEIIGDMVDLRTTTRDDLYHHYRAHYVPTNAVLALAGDFEMDSMLDRIRELYEPLTGGDQPDRTVRPEPDQFGELRVTVEGPGETTYVQVAYRSLPATHPDFFAYLVLDSLLSGPSNLNMFGAGISNKTSRLYQAVVEKELAVSVSGGLSATIDPFLHAIVSTVHPQSSPERAIQALDDEVKLLQDETPPVAELERAVKQARAWFAYGSESISNQAFWMGYSEMFDTYAWFINYLDRLASVTPQDGSGFDGPFSHSHHRSVSPQHG